jgi:hypothetical protein
VAGENSPHTNGYAFAFRKHQNIKILAQLIQQNHSPEVLELPIAGRDGILGGPMDYRNELAICVFHVTVRGWKWR